MLWLVVGWLFDFGLGAFVCLIAWIRFWSMVVWGLVWVLWWVGCGGGFVGCFGVSVVWVAV